MRELCSCSKRSDLNEAIRNASKRVLYYCALRLIVANLLGLPVQGDTQPQSECHELCRVSEGEEVAPSVPDCGYFLHFPFNLLMSRHYSLLLLYSALWRN